VDRLGLDGFADLNLLGHLVDAAVVCANAFGHIFVLLKDHAEVEHL
jgi:hypothetical protein